VQKEFTRWRLANRRRSQARSKNKSRSIRSGCSYKSGLRRQERSGSSAKLLADGCLRRGRHCTSMIICWSHLVLCLLTGLIITGCSTNTKSTTSFTNESDIQSFWSTADEYVERKDYVGAWSLITATPTEFEEPTIKYLNSHPEVYDAGKDAFSREQLTKIKVKGTDKLIVYRKLDRFERFAKPEDYKIAKKM
jgi:hypothetical protein